tara:strand:- start:4272 stop:5186 length:915 start_codon:yes stop_codon:yes gene_type:complete
MTNSNSENTDINEYNKYPPSKYLSQLDEKLKYNRSKNIQQRFQKLTEIESGIEEEIKDIYNELTKDDTTNPNPYKFKKITNSNLNDNLDTSLPTFNSENPEEYKRSVDEKLADIKTKYNQVKSDAIKYKDDLNSWETKFSSIKRERLQRINKLLGSLKHIQEERKNIINFLNDYNESSNQNILNTASDLENHKYTIAMGKDYDDLLNERVGNFSQEKDNKKRMTQIVNYENKRMASHQYIFKVLAIGFLFILGGFMFGGPFQILRYTIVTITTFIMLYLVLTEMYWNSKRDHTDWDKISWDSPY